MHLLTLYSDFFFISHTHFLYAMPQGELKVLLLLLSFLLLLLLLFLLLLLLL